MTWVSNMVSESRALLGMALLRFLSACIELSAAFFMLSLANLRTAVRINAVLGLVGPTILMAATLVGIAGLSSQASQPRWVLVLLGVGLVWMGTR